MTKSITAKDVENYIRSSGKLVNEHNLTTVCKLFVGEGHSMLECMAWDPFYKNIPHDRRHQ